MDKYIFTFCLFFLSVGKSVIAENICHKKPAGECEDCCLRYNNKNFKEAIKESCSRFKGVEEKQREVLIKSEKKAYIARQMIVKGAGRVKVDSYFSYLDSQCDFKLGKLKVRKIKMNYSECAKDCPPPQKNKGGS